MERKKTHPLKRFDFSSFKKNGIIGLLKKGKVRKFTRYNKRIGGINVGYLREFLKYLKDDNVIGVYIDKQKRLVPLHCKRRLLAPMWNMDKEKRRKQEEDEFDKE